MERKQKIMENLDLYYNELRDLIYQITVDKDGWLNFSKRLLHILQASYVHIQAIDFLIMFYPIVMGSVICQ